MTYHMVEDSFWTDDKLVRAPNAAKQVMLFLMTGPQANLAGCSCVRLMTIADALYAVEINDEDSLPEIISKVKAGLSFLKDNDIIKRCDETGWTWLVNHLKHRPIPNPKAGIAAMRVIKTIPQTLPFYQEVMCSYRIHLKESEKRTKNNEPVLPEAQITALIQSHKKRYGIDTVSGNKGANKDLNKQGLNSSNVRTISGQQNQTLRDRYPIRHSTSNSKKESSLRSDSSDSAARNTDMAAQMVEIWNQVCGEFKRSRLTKDRKRSLPAKLKSEFQSSLDEWRSFCARVEASDFLSGRKTEWMCDLDWCLKPKSMTKILEGNYDNRSAPNGGGPAGSYRGPERLEDIIRDLSEDDEERSLDDDNGGLAGNQSQPGPGKPQTGDLRSLDRPSDEIPDWIDYAGDEELEGDALKMAGDRGF